MELGSTSEEYPITFTGRYKHTESQDYITLTTIRVYKKEAGKQKTICNHINLKKSSIPQYMILDVNVHNRKVYFVGEVILYEHDGKVRAGIQLIDKPNEIIMWFADPKLNFNELKYQ
ncbi:hypothetical protein C9E88_014620 [Acinetobacter cumulans]|uniref:hypothetical protein n=2 Tax=Acinetobacter TaxID=469 RepID=UPI000D134054|nr:hypothetical protein [Acinetobacter cumulans]QCO22637.1 hypothetical protein C9E88_014620 [Acinetobacter cumulans]